jgi:four helix bundle protein
MNIERFEQLLSWQKARDLNLAIYRLTNKELFSKDFGLKDQIRRSSVSVASNISEGFERNGNKEFIQFLSIAKGSLGELRTQLYLALDLNYITKEEFEKSNSDGWEVSKLIGGLINYLKKSELKGNKYILEEPSVTYGLNLEESTPEI